MGNPVSGAQCARQCSKFSEEIRGYFAFFGELTMIERSDLVEGDFRFLPGLSGRGLQKYYGVLAKGKPIHF